MPDVDVGTGITVAFTTSAWSGEITNVSFPGMSRESLETSHQGTTVAMTFTPADLYDAGEFTFDSYFNPATDLMIDKVAETVTVTFPDDTAYSFNGFVTTDAITGDLNEIMMRTMTVKISGEITQG